MSLFELEIMDKVCLCMRGIACLCVRTRVFEYACVCMSVGELASERENESVGAGVCIWITLCIYL